MSLNHPSSDMIHKQSEIISEKWEGLTDMVEERVALMLLSFNFHEKQDQVITTPPDVLVMTCTPYNHT